VLTTAALLAPTTIAFGPHSGPQAAGVMPPSAQFMSTILEDHIATLAFERRLSDYVTMHRLLEGPLPTLEVSTDMRAVQVAMDALARRIQTARKDARQGDIFTDAVSRMFRRRIAACLAPEDWESILAEQQEGGAIAVGQPQVNAVWPAAVPFDFVPPQLLAALPHLPAELQYRIMGRALVLWDHHANLIVDFLPGALTT
jgi:hypothetical protein